MKRLALVSPLRGFSLTTHTSLSHSSFSSLAPPPPHSLLDFPPLASLTNVIVDAFNALRQCAPLAGGPEISQELQRLLESTVHDVVEYYRIEHKGFTAKNLEAYRQLVRVVLVDFLPFVKTTFDGLYSQEKVLQLAMTSSPYAVRNQTSRDIAAGNLSSSTLRGVGVDVVRMRMDVQEIGEPLRDVAPEMFQELKAAAERQRLEQDSLTADVASVTITAAVQEEASLSGDGGSSGGFSHVDTVPGDVNLGDHSLPDVNSDVVESPPRGGEGIVM